MREIHLPALEKQLAASHGGGRMNGGGGGTAAAAWICGEQFTLADVSWASIFERMEAACWIAAGMLDGMPRVQAWWAAVQRRPAFEQAIAAEGRVPCVRRGTLRIEAWKREHAFVRELYRGAVGGAA